MPSALCGPCVRWLHSNRLPSRWRNRWPCCVRTRRTQGWRAARAGAVNVCARARACDGLRGQGGRVCVFMSGCLCMLVSIQVHALARTHNAPAHRHTYEEGSRGPGDTTPTRLCIMFLSPCLCLYLCLCLCLCLSLRLCAGGGRKRRSYVSSSAGACEVCLQCRFVGSSVDQYPLGIPLTSML